MAHNYVVELQNGARIPAPSNQHHADYSEEEFKKHLIDYCIQTAAGVTVAFISGIFLNGAEVTEFNT